MCSHLFAVYQKGYRLFNKIDPCFTLKEGIVYAIKYISVLYQIKTPVKQTIISHRIQKASNSLEALKWCRLSDLN